MRRALALAERGRGMVEPNPMVGAVLVREGKIIAEGWHERFGGPHAEIEALRAAAAVGAETSGATLYVTLEPCCHHGKTPPCTDAILRAGLRRVVAAMRDPDERVSGRGLRILREAGVETETGLCESEARRLLGAYVKLRTRRRPWCIAKWAQTTDGCLALPEGEGRWISHEESRRRVHELRGLCDGVLVGVGTVLADNPLLTNRSGRGRSPVRVVLDTRLRLPPDCRLLRTVALAPVLIAAGTTAVAEQPERLTLLRQRGAEVLPLPETDGRVSLPALLDALGRREWTYLLIEGGPTVLRSFLEKGLLDELQVYVSPKTGALPELPRLSIEEVLARGEFPEVRQGISGEDTFLRCLRPLPPAEADEDRRRHQF